MKTRHFSKSHEDNQKQSMVSYHVITPLFEHLPFLEVNVQLYLHIFPILQSLLKMQGLNKALRLERKWKKSVIITTSSSTDLSSAFYLVQSESLLAPFPEKKFFPLDYATKAAGRGR